MSRWLLIVGALLGLLWLILEWPAAEPDSEAMPLGRLMGDRQGGDYLKAVPGRALRFPEDHARHPGFQNEWWYLTANLRTVAPPEQDFGLQFTLFRFALTDRLEQADANNPWLSPDIYMAHFALSNGAAGEHRAVERISREGPGLAGAGPVTEAGRGSRLAFWLADWQMQSLADGRLFPLSLQLRDGSQQMAASLAVTSVKPRVLQGERGYSLKNSEGGASYYYSYPRLRLEGTLQWEQHAWQVEGEGWFDHEWSSNSLAEYQAGWDWFSLQLSDRRELMYYRFRNRDGSEGLRHLLLVEADGRARNLQADRLRLQVTDHWVSEAGVRYPAQWRLRLPEEGLDLEIEPLLEDQLMDLSVRYWEGAVRVFGSHQGKGYVELAGYGAD